MIALARGENERASSGLQDVCIFHAVSLSQITASYLAPLPAISDDFFSCRLETFACHAGFLQRGKVGGQLLAAATQALRLRKFSAEVAGLSELGTNIPGVLARAHRSLARSPSPFAGTPT